MDTNEIFIGRGEPEKRLRKDVFFVKEGSYGKCYSLIGPNGTGKTMLIRRLSEELEDACPPNTYYFSTVLEDGITFWGFWTGLILQFADRIEKKALERAPVKDKFCIEKIQDTYRFFKENAGNMESALCRQYAVTLLNLLFIHYTRLGIRIILTIDEFDRARTIFKDGQFFQRLFGLTPKGAARLNLSIVTVSRRSVSTIAHHMQEGSNFQDAYPPVALKGFDNAGLEQYFSTYEELECGLLSEEVKQEMLCLCGRSPGLLMSMRHEIELLEKEAPDISRIYAEHGAFIKTAYERMCTLMKTEYVDQGKTVSSMSIFIQQFIGPVYTEKLSERVEKLYDYGFITKVDEKEKNVFELSGLKDYRDRGALVYEPISPCFVDFVKDVVVPDDLKSLAGLLERTERSVRKVLLGALTQRYPDSWEEVLDAEILKKDDYLDKLRQVASANDYAMRNITISKLNVLAFHDYFRIIRNHWDIMQKYFSLYDSVSALKSDMHVLNESRNTSAHLNLEILNNANRRSLREICEFMLKNFEEAGALY